MRACPEKTPGTPGRNVPAEVEFLEHQHDGRVQPIDVVAHRDAESFERKRKVGRKLARQVKHAAAAAIDPVDLDPQRAKRVIIRPDVSAAAGAAHADGGGMLAKDQRRPPLLSQVVDDPSLELLDL